MKTLERGESAVVFEIASDVVATTSELLTSRSARQVAVETVDASISALFD
ncbi:MULTISPECIES: hypothetical protein [unclassified Rathayibacter]|nr:MULTISPECIES: hypothetical protein [unclassified Rathayibacter]